MSELFEDNEDKVIVADDDMVETESDLDAEAVDVDVAPHPAFDARRRLEDLLEEKRLRDELEDFIDYE